MNDYVVYKYLSKNVKLGSIITNYVVKFMDCDDFYDRWGDKIRGCRGKKGRNSRRKKKQQLHLLNTQKRQRALSSEELGLSMVKRNTAVSDSYGDRSSDVDTEYYYDDDKYDCTLHGKNGVELDETYTNDFTPYAYDEDYYKYDDAERRSEMKWERDREWRQEFSF